MSCQHSVPTFDLTIFQFVFQGNILQTVPKVKSFPFLLLFVYFDRLMLNVASPTRLSCYGVCFDDEK